MDKGGGGQKIQKILQTSYLEAPQQVAGATEESGGGGAGDAFHVPLSMSRALILPKPTGRSTGCGAALHPDPEEII